MSHFVEGGSDATAEEQIAGETGKDIVILTAQLIAVVALSATPLAGIPALGAAITVSKIVTRLAAVQLLGAERTVELEHQLEGLAWDVVQEGKEQIVTGATKALEFSLDIIETVFIEGRHQISHGPAGPFSVDHSAAEHRGPSDQQKADVVKGGVESVIADIERFVFVEGDSRESTIARALFPGFDLAGRVLTTISARV